MLEARAASLNRWLGLVAMFLTFFGIVVTIVASFGFYRYVQLEDQVANQFDSLTVAVERVEKIAKEMEEKKRKAFNQEFPDQEALAGPGAEARSPMPSDLGRNQVFSRGGELARREGEKINVRLAERGSYVFGGFCDDNCLDLDLVLYGDSGQVLERDVSADGIPFVSYTAEGPEEAVLEVRMYHCSAVRCAWGLLGSLKGHAEADLSRSQG